MSDTFFSASDCSRCGGPLTARIMSWFTNETICMKCSQQEGVIRSFLPDNGDAYEGCGYVPEQCDHCNGYGSSLKDKPEDIRCTKCGGSGLMIKDKV